MVKLWKITKKLKNDNKLMMNLILVTVLFREQISAYFGKN